ncbi:hypothetical protein ACOMHN_066237 [Nucella lapillus]
MAFHLPADGPLSSSLRHSSSCSAGLSQRESQQTAAKWNPRLAGHCYILRLSKSGHEGISIRDSCYAVEVCSEVMDGSAAGWGDLFYTAVFGLSPQRGRFLSGT